MARVLARLRGMPRRPPTCAGTTRPAAAHSSRTRPPGSSTSTRAPSWTRCRRRRSRPRCSPGSRRATTSPSCPTGRSPRPSTATRRRGLDAVPHRDRRVAAGRDDQAAPGDLRGGAGRARRPGSRASILHVGDDWAADVAGAKAAGWRAAYSARGRTTRRSRAASGTTTPTRTWRRLELEDARRPGGRPEPGVPSVDSLLMEARDRLANLGLLAAAGVAWILVAILLTTRDPYHDPMAGYVGALLIGLAVGLPADPAVLARSCSPVTADRLPGRLVPGGAPRRLGRPVHRGARHPPAGRRVPAARSCCSSPPSSSSPS